VHLPDFSGFIGKLKRQFSSYTRTWKHLPEFMHDHADEEAGPTEEDELLANRTGIGYTNGEVHSQQRKPAPRASRGCRYSYGRTKIVLTSNYVNVLLIFVPLGIIAGELGWPSTATFILNFLAIIPLAALLSFATEELSLEVGETLGGLMNATFGNAVELIVSPLPKLSCGKQCCHEQAC